MPTFTKKKSSVELAQAYKEQEAKLRSRLLGGLEKLMAKEKKKASACKDAIILLEKEKGDATAEISNIMQLKRSLTED